MSAVLKAAKISRINRAHPGVFSRYHRGDPGILDSIWNGIKGAATGFMAGGPVGAILGGTQGLAGQKNAGTNVAATLQRFTGGRSVTQAGPGLAAPVAVNVATAGIFGFGDPTKPKPPLMPGADGRDTDGGIPGPGEWMDSMGVRHKSAYANGGCPSGYHVNKSGYYTRQGYVAPGTQCVKNRKRNPLNPRAASRALSRLTSTRKAMRGIERLMNKIGGSRPARVSAAPFGRKKKGCGCR